MGKLSKALKCVFFLQKEIEKEEEAEKGQWGSNQTHHPFFQKKFSWHKRVVEGPANLQPADLWAQMNVLWVRQVQRDYSWVDQLQMKVLSRYFNSNDQPNKQTNLPHHR